MQSNILRQQRISYQLQQLHQDQDIMITECQYEGLLREDFWVLWVRGKGGSQWEGMVIPVQISFPKLYPMDAPDIVFPKDFQHIHVYESGDVCLPILESQYWKPRSSMGELIKRTINLIHQEINPYSPANQTLYTMYKMDRQKYEKVMKEQKERFKEKNGKYFRIACVHIDVYNHEDV